MSDKFAGTTERLESPPQHLVEVTPDDDNDLPLEPCIIVRGW